MSLQLFMAGVNIVSSIAAGQAAKAESELNVFNMETDQVWRDAIAGQQNNERMTQYNLAKSANVAMFSATRDVGSDMSVAAFMESNKKTVGKDVRRVTQQRSQENFRAQGAMGAERRRGQNAAMAGLFDALGFAAKGFSDYSQTKIGHVDKTGQHKTYGGFL